MRRYYDENTPRFVRRGYGGAFMHRAVWAPGVTSRDAAFSWVENLVLKEIGEASPSTTVLDLGCGVGESLVYIAKQSAVRGIGVTLSGVQVAHARERFARAGLSERLSCVQTSFLALPPIAPPVDVAFAIESFAHSSSGELFFESVSRVLRPGGRLVVCDDFLAERTLSQNEARLVERFREGWRVGTLVSLERASVQAKNHGFSLLRSLDLTGYLEPSDLRQLGIRFGGWLGRRLGLDSEYLRSWDGGDALRRSLASGAIGYRVATFARDGEASAARAAP